MEIWFLLAAIAAIITLSSFVQSSMGFGYAIVSLAVLPFVLDVRDANVVVSLSMIVPLLFAVWAYREGIDWRTMVCCLAGSALGLPLGLLIFSTIDADVLVRGTGVAILILAIDGLRPRREADVPRQASRLWSACAGCASGLLAGSVGMGGPPVAAYAARQPWSPNQFKAFLISFSLALSVLKALGLTATGWTTGSALFYTAAAAPFGFLGCQLGIVASRNINARRFRQITMTVLVMLSLGMIVRGQPGDADTPAGQTAAHHDRQQAPAGAGAPHAKQQDDSTAGSRVRPAS